MFCPECGKQIPDQSKFCFECGADLRQSLGDMATAVNSSADGSLQDATLSGGATVVQASSVAEADGRYQILETIGKGGMGEVYKAKDNRLHRVVALKRLLSQLSGSQRAIDRFFNEAKSIAALNHPNIVNVYDFGEDADGYYIAMEYVEGVTLKEYLREKGKLNAEEASRILLSIAKGLSTAHERGVIHRDIKPANILINSKGQPKLTDFGIARAADSEEMTRTGIMMGTPDYCSPEQQNDAKNVDHRTDIYSLGATFYEMVTGEIPKYYREEHIPAGLRPFVRKAMAKPVAERYQSVAELIDAFETELGIEESTGAKATCPQCGSGNPMDVKFCIKCGNGLSHLFEKCPKCSRENRIDIEFCGGCGYSLYNFRKILKLKEKALKLRAEYMYEDALSVWHRILGMEADNKESIEGKKQEESSLKTIQGHKDSLKKARENKGYEQVLDEIELLTKLDPKFEQEFYPIEKEAIKGISYREAERKTTGFEQGKNTAEEALKLWEEYLGFADTEEERALTQTVINDIVTKQTNLYDLEKELDGAFQKKDYNSCAKIIVNIRKIQNGNTTSSAIEQKIREAKKEANSLFKKTLSVRGEKDFDSGLKNINKALEFDPFDEAIGKEKKVIEGIIKGIDDKAREIQIRIFDEGTHEKIISELNRLIIEYPKTYALMSFRKRIEEWISKKSEAERLTQEFRSGRKDVVAVISAWEGYLRAVDSPKDKDIAIQAIEVIRKEDKETSAFTAKEVVRIKDRIVSDGITDHIVNEIKALTDRYPLSPELKHLQDRVNESITNRQKAERLTEGFREGTNSAPDAINAWGEYINSLDGENLIDRKIATQKIDELRKKDKSLSELLEKLDHEFVAKKFEICEQIISDIKHFQTKNVSAGSIEKKIADIKRLVEKQSTSARELVAKDEYENAAKALETIFDLTGDNKITETINLYRQEAQRLSSLISQVKEEIEDKDIYKAKELLDNANFANNFALTKLRQNVKEEIATLEALRSKRSKLPSSIINNESELNAAIVILRELTQKSAFAIEEKEELEVLEGTQKKLLDLKREALSLCEQKRHESAAEIIEKIKLLLPDIDATTFLPKEYQIHASNVAYRARRTDHLKKTVALILSGPILLGIGFKFDNPYFAIIGLILGLPGIIALFYLKDLLVDS